MHQLLLITLIKIPAKKVITEPIIPITIDDTRNHEIKIKREYGMFTFPVAGSKKSPCGL
ncbi:hypothetical protein [Risungbinella massiliensis]|uniref:hypothetical protein n=1 Tax=Risungbinella massiliensis TaxID=1329796 RepID=UPI0012B62BD9|nr:hypothetical protein [Risungbinella massiliensis]